MKNLAVFLKTIAVSSSVNRQSTFAKASADRSAIMNAARYKDRHYKHFESSGFYSSLITRDSPHTTHHSRFTTHAIGILFLKRLLLSAACLLPLCMQAQDKTVVYPTPEFSNEVYYFKKDSGKITRLEKSSGSMDTKTRMAGFGGAESGYVIEGAKSTVRFTGGDNLSFVYFTGQGGASNPHADSVMRANGLDPSMSSDGMAAAMDPSRTVTLYAMSNEKSSRKIIIYSAGGMKLMGKGKKASTKYTLSVKPVRPGYYELVVDKSLPKGEYAFTVMGMTGMDGSATMFCFGID